MKRTVIIAVMDESSAARASAQAAQDSGGGGGGAEAPCVVNRAGPLEACRLHNLVRCANKTVGGVTGQESQLGLEMKAAFFDCVRKEFASEGFYDIKFTNMFLGWSCQRDFGHGAESVVMGYCIMAKDMGGSIMVVYYTTPTAASRVGTLGYTLDAIKFFDMLTSTDKKKQEVVEIAKEMASPNRNVDQELCESMKAIQPPKASVNSPGLFQQGFQAKFSVPNSGHPYSLVINTVANRIAELFKTLHSVHVKQDLDKSNSNSRDFIRYMYRVCHYACGHLDKLNTKLTHEGGGNVRSLEYFNLRRFSNYSKWEYTSLVSDVSTVVCASIQGFISKVDRSIYSIFHQSRGCPLFLTAGKLLTVETEREIRARRRRGRRMHNDDTEEDEDDNDETGSLIFRSLGDIPAKRRPASSTSNKTRDLLDDDDSELFNSMLVSQVPKFFSVMSTEITDFISDRVLHMFNQGACVEEAEAQQLLLLAQTVKNIHLKVQIVKDRILVYTFIPDFLDQIIPSGPSGRARFDPFRKHLEVVRTRFPGCVWSPPVTSDGSHLTIREKLDLFVCYLSEVTQVQIPPVSEQISACQKILKFLGESCLPEHTVVTAIRLVNEGRLGAARSKGKTAAGKRTPRADPSISSGQSTMAGGDVQSECAEATESRRSGDSRRRSNVSGGNEVGGEAEQAVGSRTRAEVDVGNMIGTDRSTRARRTTERFSTAKGGGTMMKRPEEGFEIPELVQLREAMQERQRRSAIRDRSAAPVDPLPVFKFLCPDHRDMSCTETEQKFIVPFVECTVIEFMDSLDFPERKFAFIHYTEGEPISTIVEVQLLLCAPSNAGRRQVGVRQIDGDTYVYNVNVVRPRRQKNQPPTVEPDGTPGRQESAPSSVNFESAPPVGIETDGLQPPRPSRGLVSDSTARAATRGAAGASAGASGRGASSHLSMAHWTRMGGGVEVIENPLHCGRIMFAKHVNGGELARISSERLYTHYRPDTVDRARRCAVAGSGGFGSQSIYSDGVSLHEDHDDDEYTPPDDSGMASESGAAALITPLALNPRSVEHANAPWVSFDEMKQTAESNGWTMLNPVSSFVIIYDPDERVVAVVPSHNLSKAGKCCVYAFLNRMNSEFRTIYGPFYLQFQDTSNLDDLSERSIYMIINNVFRADAFKVFTTQKRGDGKTYLVETNDFLDMYLETVLSNYDPYRVKFVSLFQLCPYNTSTGDPMVHRSPHCCFKLDESSQIDTTRLVERMNRHQRAAGVITNANVCYVPGPGCQCLFHDIAERDFCVSLLGRDDSRLDRVARKGFCVYAVEKVGDDYKWFTIESSFGSRKKQRVVESRGVNESQPLAAGHGETSDDSD